MPARTLAVAGAISLLASPLYHLGPAPAYSAPVGVQSPYVLLGADSSGQSGNTTAVSCPSAGNCAVGGSFQIPYEYSEPFVQSEVDGVWQPAVDLASDLSDATNVGISDISCGSAGNCAAAGTYESGGATDAWVASEVDGVWGPEQQVGANVEAGDYAYLYSVSCGTPGDCVAVGGVYVESNDQLTEAGLLVQEVGGTWLPARAVFWPDTGNDDLDWVDCPTATSCLTTGVARINDVWQPFTYEEESGTWQFGALPFLSAEEGFGASIASISCPAAGDCIAVGSLYTEAAASSEVQTTTPEYARESNFQWSTPHAYSVGVTVGNSAGFQEVTCPAVSECAMTGFVELPGDDPQNYSHGFVAIEHNGSTTYPFEVNNGGPVSWYPPWIGCVSTTTCVIEGTVDDASTGGPNVFAQEETGGIWSAAFNPLKAFDNGIWAQGIGFVCAPRASCLMISQATDAQSGATVPVAQGITPQPDVAITGFSQNGTALSAAMAREVRSIAESIAATPSVHEVDVAGYGDANTPKSTTTARANAVATALRADLHAMHAQSVSLSVVGYGATGYVASNSTASGRAQNRRVVVLY